MRSIKDAFAKGKAFIPFITCGDPDLESTKKLVKSMVENGADLIELGIPFSDPTAEGPVIMEADLRALSRRMHHRAGFSNDQGASAGSGCALCVYDLCQCGFLLRQ